MNETGAVKFHYESSGKELAPFPGFEELNAAREELRRLGLLGVDESGIGFGNVSMRDGVTDSFYITGSATGALPSLGLVDYAKVIAWDFERNWLRCEGQAIASAESLTHAAVYSMAAEVRVVCTGMAGIRGETCGSKALPLARRSPTARRRWRGRFSGCFVKPTCARGGFSRWPDTRMGSSPSARTSMRHWPPLPL